jgi:beta-lactamase class A
MLTRKIPFYYLLLTILLLGGATLYVLHEHGIIGASGSSYPAGKEINATAATDSAIRKECKIATQKGFELIKPILWAKPVDESPEYAALKASVTNLIEDNKNTGILTTASVYFMDLNNGAWTYINPNENFHPASLVKVPLLITFLHEAEKNPQILDKKVTFEKQENVPTQHFNSLTIQLGNTYTIKELLKYMIVYSDNNATNLLNQHVDKEEFKKAFSDLNIPEPDLRDPNFLISAKRYSRFILVLYNASYLSNASSEYAMELLTQCNFKEGMVKQIPADTKVAHKFGEWGSNVNNVHELHESGIVYVKGKPYLLTIMTRGANPLQLTDVVSKISKVIYDEVSAKSTATAKL